MFRTVLSVLTLLLTLLLFGCNEEVVTDPRDKVEQQCWEDWSKFLVIELPPLKDYYSNHDIIIERGRSDKFTDFQKMYDTATRDSKRNIAGALRTDIGYNDIFSRSFQDYTLEISGSGRGLAESFYNGIVNQAVEMSRELFTYDFTPIDKGYWVVRYITIWDIEVARAKEMMKIADIVTQVQRDEFIKRMQEEMEEAKKRNDQIEKKLKEMINK